MTTSTYQYLKNRIQAIVSTPTRQRLANGAFWSGIATCGSRLLMVASSFFLARILGQVGFGEYGMVNSTVGMVSGLAGMGIGLTVTKHVAQYKTSAPDKVGQILALSTLVTIISATLYGLTFIFLAQWLATKTLSAPHLAPLLQISAITIVLGVINGVQTSSLVGVEAFRANSSINIGTGIAQTLLVLTGAWVFGLKGAIAGMALSRIITVLITRFVVAHQWHRLNIQLRWHDAFKQGSILLHFSLPTFLTMAFIGPVFWACSAFLANKPNGYAQLGIFNASAQWQAAMQFLPGFISAGMLPIMAEKCGAGDIISSLNVMKRMMKLILYISVPIALILSIASPFIMKGYGDNFANGYWAMIMLVAAGTLSAIMTPVGNFVAASGMMWQGLLFNTGWIISMLVGSWYLVQWGAEGLALSRLLATIVHSVFILFFIRHVYSNHNKKTPQSEGP